MLSKYDVFEMIVEYSEEYEEYELDELIILFLITGIVSTCFAIRRIVDAIDFNKSLESLNVSLKKEIADAVEKRKEQDELIAEQSKLVSMGEMIGNISYHWRKSLNGVGQVVQNIHQTYTLNKLSDEFMNACVLKSELILSSMSKTIENFQNLFQVKEDKQFFLLSKCIETSLVLINKAYVEEKIDIRLQFNDCLEVFTFKNELRRVIFNILENIKNTIISNNTLNPYIKILTHEDTFVSYIEIYDNTSEMKEEELNRIFEPYSSSKEEGLGLFMSQNIMKEHIKGELSVENTTDGRLFILKIFNLKNIDINLGI